MIRNIWACFLVGGALLLVAGTPRAQEPPPPPTFGHQAEGPDGGGPPGAFGDRMELLGFGGVHGGKVVTNAPFCATATTTQTLADGNQITRTSNVCRDSQGRFSREMTLPGGSHPVVLISDPVAHKQSLLRPDQKVAYVYEMPGRGMKGGPKGLGKGGPGERPWKGNAEANVQKVPITSAPPMNFGVNVEGTQYTQTIRAGQIGNAQDISSVSQSWYSPDLQVVVMKTDTDPRFGTITYTLTNIQRHDPGTTSSSPWPPPEKFTVPPGYTVKEGRPPAMGRFRGGSPAGAPATPPPSN
jgi:hypothetical protein